MRRVAFGLVRATSMATRSCRERGSAQLEPADTGGPALSRFAERVGGNRASLRSRTGSRTSRRQTLAPAGARPVTAAAPVTDPGSERAQAAWGQAVGAESCSWDRILSEHGSSPPICDDSPLWESPSA
jgi:hypothetical protein